MLAWWLQNRYKGVEKRCWESCLFAVIRSLQSTVDTMNEILFDGSDLDRMDLINIIRTRVVLCEKFHYALRDYSIDDFDQEMPYRMIKAPRICSQRPLKWKGYFS